MSPSNLVVEAEWTGCAALGKQWADKFKSRHEVESYRRLVYRFAGGGGGADPGGQSSCAPAYG